MSGRSRGAGLRSNSLARRLILELAVIAALSSVLLYVAVRALSGEASEATHDGILAASAEAIAERLGSDANGVSVDLPYGALAMLGAVSEDRVFYRIVLETRTLTGYDDLPLPQRLPSPGETLFYSEVYRGSVVRIAALSRRVSVDARSLAVMTLVAQTLDRQRDIVARLAGRATLVGIASFALAGLLGALAVWRALAPLRRLVESLERRGPQDLSPLSHPLPRELIPLGRSLDGFMRRLDASLERTETFIGEAAHHVRTPLAVVRTRAEAAMRQSHDDEVRATLRSLVRAVDESARSADQLLEHAMVMHRSERMAREPVPVSEMVAGLVRSLEPVAELRDLTLRARLSPDIRISGDRIQIEVAVRNLLDNALKYSPAEALIDVEVCLDESCQVLVAVRDHGRGLRGGSAESLSERYRRGSNVDDVVGSGLGLAIAGQVAVAHGGWLSIAPAPGVGTRACLHLPPIGSR